jgi:hypothetical protein
MNQNYRPPEPYWTDEMVFAYLQKAADICRKLPSVKPQGYVSLWPNIKRDLMEMIQGDSGKGSRGYAIPREVSFFEHVEQWTRWCNADETKVIWRRAARKPWKLIEYELKISETTGRRRLSYGIMKITAKLNAHDPEGAIIQTYPTYQDVDLNKKKT